MVVLRAPYVFEYGVMLLNLDGAPTEVGFQELQEARGLVATE